MTTARIYYSAVFGIFVVVETDSWFMELAEIEMNEDYWCYIGDL